MKNRVLKILVGLLPFLSIIACENEVFFGKSSMITNEVCSKNRYEKFDLKIKSRINLLSFLESKGFL